MLSLSSLDAMLAAARSARAVRLDAYTLGRGSMLGALEAAAAGGAHVSVRLQGVPVAGTGDGVARANAGLAAELARHGIDVRLSGAAEPALHAKTLVADGALFLDDRNFAPGGIALRDDDPADPAVARSKRAALAQERTVLDGPRDSPPNGSADAIVESESFGCCNAAWAGLRDLARRGFAPRLLVCSRELANNARERTILDGLRRLGVRVRTTDATDKLAVAGSRAWLGSANATAAIATPDEIDWGVTTADPTIVAAARARFERSWSRAKPLDPPDAPDASDALRAEQRAGVAVEGLREIARSEG